MSVLKVKNGNQWDIVPAIKGDPGDPAADESITDDMLVTDGIKTEIEWLWGNQLMDSREGELLHAEDAYTAPAVDISVDGKSTQVTTTGAQMLNDATSTRGYRTNPNGNPIAASSYSMSDYIPVDASTAYYFVNMVGSQNGYTLCEYDSEKAFIQYQTIYGTTSAVDTRTTSETTAYIIVSYLTANADTAMVSKGSTATDYEPYTGGKPAPSPDYPQEIGSVDEPSAHITGKNLLNVADWELDSNSNVALAEDGTALYIGQQSYQERLNRYYLPVSANCILSFDYETVDLLNENACLNILVYKADGTTAGTSGQIMLVEVGHKASITIVIPSSTAYLAFGQWGQRGHILVRNIQLELGSTATTYEPYLGNTASLLPDGYSLRSLPDGTKDELHLSYLRPSKRAGWAWYSRELVKRIGTIDLGTLSWSKYGTQDNTFFAIISNIKRHYLGVLCTAYKQVQGGVDTLTNGEFSTSSGGNTSIWFRNDSYTVAADFKAAVSGVTLDYILATPITETLDPIELPIMPSRTINVWSDPATNLKMTYIQDSNLIIENLEATIADIATS